MLLHKTKSEQQIQHLFNNRFTENKPIPFPDYNRQYAYSNLFYWAHLVAHETAEFPLHGHKGFEIMTFVLNGSLEHFDTATKVWTPIEEGGFQVTKTGSGVMHSERIVKDSELFQVWFDPDFSKTLKTEPAYKDYIKEDVSEYQADGIKILEYIGDKNSISHQTEGIKITREFYKSGTYTKVAAPSSIYSIYVIKGDGTIEQKDVTKDDFVIVDDISTIFVDVADELELFVIQSPKVLSYPKVRV